MALVKRVNSSIDYSYQKRSKLISKPTVAATTATIATDIVSGVLMFDFRNGDYRHLPAQYLPSLQELNELLGDEWAQVSSDPYLLKEWLNIIITNRLIDDGIRPPWFIYPAQCMKCGPIFLDYEEHDILNGCPWCFNKV